MQQQNRYRKVIQLSLLYTICIGSVVLAFPKNAGYTENSMDGAYLGAAKNIGTILPVTITWGQGGAKDPVVQKPQPVVSKTITPRSPTVVKPITSKNTTCSDVGICDKVRFEEGYTERQKSQYYSIIIETIATIEKALGNNKLSKTLSSLTLYNKQGDRRGWGGSKTIIINTQGISSLQEFREILTHELAHIIDLGVIIGSSSDINKGFAIGGQYIFASDDTSLNFYTISWENDTTRKANALYTDFVGGYAMTNPYEDFAESFTMYIWHNSVFYTMAQYSWNLEKKYDFIGKLVGGLVLASDSKNASQVLKNPKWRPRDSTRLGLE